MAHNPGRCSSAMPRRNRVRRREGCRACALCGPHGECRDKALKSGRCGDWVWYMIGSKQYRRRYARPRDPRTLEQVRSRTRFGAVSRRYSDSLTDEQQDAHIATGAKLRTRKRMGSSGPMTGHQHWMKTESARQEAVVKAKRAQFASQVQQPQPLPRPTSDTHPIHTGNTRATHAATTRQPCGSHAATTRHPTKPPRGDKAFESRTKRAVPLMEVKQIQTLTRSTGARHRSATGTTRPRGADLSGGSPPRTRAGHRKASRRRHRVLV